VLLSHIISHISFSFKTTSCTQIYTLSLHDALPIYDTFDEQSESYTIGLMDVKTFHGNGVTGRGVKVAVLDTGVQKHVDLNVIGRSEEHTSELQSRFDLVCRLLLEKKKKINHKLTD